MQTQVTNINQWCCWHVTSPHQSLHPIFKRKNIKYEKDKGPYTRREKLAGYLIYLSLLYSSSLALHLQLNYVILNLLIDNKQDSNKTCRIDMNLHSFYCQNYHNTIIITISESENSRQTRNALFNILIKDSRKYII